jgi:hypothetical protein
VADIPIVMGAAGRVPTPPATLLANLLAAVAAVRPGYTANLPGSLIDDVSSTDVGALVTCDSAVSELINSLTPLGANQFALLALGSIYLGSGVAPAPPTNTAVSVVFSGAVSFVIAKGFVVSDGTYQYAVQDGGVIGQGGQSPPLFCLALTPGSWVVPPNTVTQLITSIPTSVGTVTAVNPLAGTPGGTTETEEQYRARILQAGLAAAQGMPTFMRTLLEQVSGVQARLVSPLQQTNGWEIVVGGTGDPYAVAYAIFQSLFDVSSLVGSTLNVTGITNANPGVVTVDKNHGYATGQVAQINGIVGMVNLNGVPFTAMVTGAKTFSIGINTTGYPAYVSGGVLTPNLRNTVVSILDYPDVYSIPFVTPPQQTVTISATYHTTQPNFTSQAAVAQLAAPALVSYINSVYVGQPLSLYVMQEMFIDSITSVLDPGTIGTLAFSVNINGIGVSPTGGLFIGDPESYFFATPNAVTVTAT